MSKGAAVAAAKLKMEKVWRALDLCRHMWKHVCILAGGNAGGSDAGRGVGQEHA